MKRETKEKLIEYGITALATGLAVGIAYKLGAKAGYFAGKHDEFIGTRDCVSKWQELSETNTCVAHLMDKDTIWFGTIEEYEKPLKEL